jgi:hypothetical protein
MFDQVVEMLLRTAIVVGFQQQSRWMILKLGKNEPCCVVESRHLIEVYKVIVCEISAKILE